MSDAFKQKGAARAAPSFYRARLFRRAGQIVDRGFDVGVRERCVAAFGRHRAFASDRRLHESGDALLDPRGPGRPVAELGGPGCAARCSSCATWVIS